MLARQLLQSVQNYKNHSRSKIKFLNDYFEQLSNKICAKIKEIQASYVDFILNDLKMVESAFEICRKQCKKSHKKNRQIDFIENYPDLKDSVKSNNWVNLQEIQYTFPDQEKQHCPVKQKMSKNKLNSFLSSHKSQFLEKQLEETLQKKEHFSKESEEKMSLKR